MKWLVLGCILLGLAIVAFIRLHPVFGGTPDAASLAKIRQSPQFNGEVFVNLEPTDTQLPQNNNANRPGVLKWLSSVSNPPQGKHPTQPLPSEKPDLSRLADQHFVWLGHSSLLFNLGGKMIVTDPVFHRASPIFLGGAPFAMTHTPGVADLPEKIDIVLISHDHYDHLDYQAIMDLKDRVARFYVPLGVKAHLQRWGVADDKIIEMDWHETSTQDGLPITLLPARHFSGRGLTNRNSTLWGAWAVKSGDFSVYFNGDSGYGKHFAQIGEQYGPFDIAFMENGAYNQAWPLVHMFPEQSAQALSDIRTKVGVPIHWAKFDLSFHTWKDPIERFTKAAQGKPYQVATPTIGQVFGIDDLPHTRWWESVK